MGDPKGFLAYTRALPEKQKVTDRIAHSKEFISCYTPEALHEQSARCMNCGVPFCHSGCPLGNMIPEFNDAIYRERWAEAYEILASTNNFPEFTGRICPAPCESACVLGINQPPVAIEEIEKHVIETAFSKGLVKAKKPAVRTGKKVAVVGSGPAGLAAAMQLNYAGHTITIFERDDAAGGLLRYGIPDFKLEKSVVERRIELMKEEGVEFRLNANVGKNVNINHLLREHHAVILAGGSTTPREMDIPGRHLKGVYHAMQFLKQQNQRIAGTDIYSPSHLMERGAEWNTIVEEITAKGKNVVVIGGGDTGSDCIGTAIRQGAATVVQFDRKPTPPEDRTEHMPWPLYPLILRTSSSQEEGCERMFTTIAKEFVGDEKGQLKSLKMVNVTWTCNDEGRPTNYTEVAGSEQEIPCNLVLLALGFSKPQYAGLIQQLDLDLDRYGNVEAYEDSYQTKIDKVFACGDMRRGQSLVVWAISEGRECARKVDEFLSGASVLERKDESIYV